MAGARTINVNGNSSGGFNVAGNESIQFSVGTGLPGQWALLVAVRDVSSGLRWALVASGGEGNYGAPTLGA